MTENLGIQLGNKYIRKNILYSNMAWQAGLDFNKYHVCVSRYGGLIVMANRDTNNVRNMEIRIHNAAGLLISTFKWNSGPFLGLGWTNSDDLLCIQEDGQVLMYDIFGQFLRTFSMGKECRDHRVLEYEVFLSSSGTGLVIMNGLYRFMVVNNVDDPKVRILAQVPGLKSTPPSSWCALPGDRSCCVLAANDDEIYLLDQGDYSTRQYPAGLTKEPSSYIYMTASLNRKHVALYTNDNTIWIGSSDFQVKYCEFGCPEDSGCPKKMVWCCNCVVPFGPSNERPPDDIALVIYWLTRILVIGPGKDWIKYDVEEDYSNSIHNIHGQSVLCADVDGVHIVTPNRHEYLQHVPKTVESIYFPGSVEPGSMLFDASKEYEKHSEKADEYLRILLDKNQLEKAIEQCIIASTFEFQPRSQKQLLRAASFGKTFRPDLKLTDLFVEACQFLRVLNALRDFQVGIALTAAQLQHLKMDCLIDRLVVRRQFKLAFHICKYLKMPEDCGSSRILSHWACYKVQQSTVSHEKIAYDIRNKLKNVRGVSYASVAEKAIDIGRKDLAIKLVEFETRACKQVRLLSKLGKHTLAVEKAVESGDSELAFEAITRLRERSSLSDFLVAIRQHPTAYKLHLKYCREQNRRMLKDLHEQEDNFVELAHSHVQESCDPLARNDERNVSLHAAQDAFNKARNEFGSKITEEQVQLLKDQVEIEKDVGSFDYVSTSLHDTLLMLLSSNQYQKAEKMRKTYKVSDKRWWWLKIKSLSEQRRFSELEQFAKSKKSPIGYLPFVDACVRNQANHEAEKYISKLNKDQQVAAYVKTGNMGAACELAIQNKRVEDLELVYKKCANDRDLQDKVAQVLQQLQ